MRQVNHAKWILGVRGFHEAYAVHFSVPEKKISISLYYTLLSPDDVYDPHFNLSCVINYQDEPQNSFGITKKYDLKEGVFGSNAFFIRIKDSFIKDGYVKGKLKDSKHSIEWDFKITDIIAGQSLPYNFLYNISIPKNKLETPVLDGSINGSVQIDSQKFDLNRVKVVQNHLWGPKMHHQWNWGFCNQFDGNPDVIFEAFTGRQKLFLNLETPDVSIFYLNHRGKKYQFNKIESLILNQSDYHIGYWHFKAETFNAKIEGFFESEYKDLGAVKIKDTDLSSIFLHQTSYGSLKLDLYTREGWSYKKIESFTSKEGCFIEFANRYKDPHVNLLYEAQ